MPPHQESSPSTIIDLRTRNNPSCPGKLSRTSPSSFESNRGGVPFMMKLRLVRVWPGVTVTVLFREVSFDDESYWFQYSPMTPCTGGSSGPTLDPPVKSERIPSICTV